MSETTAGVAELIARIENDGVDVGNAERSRIIAAANEQAAKIVAAAHAEAAAIVKAARVDADATRAQLAAELRMAARDFAMSLGQRLREQVIDVAVRDEVAARFEDPKVLENVIAEVVATLAPGSDAEITVSEEVRDVIAGAAWQRIVARAGTSIELRGERRLSGFRLKLRDAHVVWDFTDAAVAAELSAFVAPTLRAYFAVEGLASRGSAAS